jgi:hypothetical protein
MASRTRTDLFEIWADARLETAIAGVVSDYRAEFLPDSEADKAPADAQLTRELRKEAMRFMQKRLLRMVRRPMYAYRAASDPSL